MKILVTGGTGFVGSEITRQLLAQGKAVRILRRSTSSLDLLGSAAHHVEQAVGDVTKPETLAPAMEGITHVYHTAASLGLDERRDRLFQINVQGTANVVNAALEAGVTRLVHTSSIAALGRPERTDIVLNESAEWHASRANTAYARSKHEAELEIHRGIAEGLDAVMVNPSLIFGVGRPGENTRRIAEKICDRKMPATPIGGTNVVDVRDVAAGHLLSMERGRTGERYFLGSENLLWRTIFATLARAFDVPPPRFTLPPGAALAFATLAETAAFLTRTTPLMTREMARQTARFYTYDNRKAITDLGCTFRPFEDTARHMAKHLGQ
ncbi:MAG TPA: SDR family oxidoreductase [Rhodothermales bacterium]|nr:SDR family oxidoreductase [Rhodothermales bacterium]